MRWSRSGVRGLTTLAATVAVALVLAVAGFALTALLRTELTAGVDAALRDRALDVGAMVDANTLTTVVPVAQDEGSLVQVLDADGTVVASSANIDGEAALVGPSSTTHPITTGTLPIGGSERYRVLAQPTGTGAARTVVVALSLGATDRAVGSAARLLWEVLPVVLALTAWVTWLGVGRALVPVERIRRKTATIGAGDLSQRVPLPRARDEVYRLAETMNAMLERIARSAERQRRFVTDASHELRSPLANMQALLEVARDRQDLDLWQETGADLAGEHTRMSRLVEDLLLLARLDGQIPLAHSEVDLDEVVHAEADALRRHGTLRIVVAPLPALRVRGDAAQLARVVRNLTDNAQRYAQSTVWLSLRSDGDRAVVRVADDGPGVPVDQQERVFDRFARLDRARARHDGGSGLGLAISREIALAHGGSLSLVPPVAGEGAAFEMRLPLADEV